MEDDNKDLFTTDVIKFLNTEFGGDLSKLQNTSEILEKISSFEKDLECQVSPFNLDPSHVVHCTKKAEDVLHSIKDAITKNEDLQTKAASELEKFSTIRDDLSARVNRLKTLENLCSYFQWIWKIEDENSRMEEAIKHGLTSQMVAIFSEIRDIWQELQCSDCKNLVEYIRKTMQYWHDILRERFGNEFEKVLNSLHWPVLSTNVSMPLNQSPENIMKFTNLFLTLYRIQLPDSYVKPSTEIEPLEIGSIMLPLQLMLQPLQKRFVFHFMSKKPTNRLDKPEWYLTQILSWISNHSIFIEKIVQPFLDKQGLSRVNARADVMQGLVRLAILRLKSDLPSLINDDVLLSHTIDEVLLFASELQNQGYPKSYPNVLQELTAEPYFSRWRSLEHQSALEKMDKFLNLETAWQPRYQDEDLDEMHVPESAELFVTLLLTMKERYCHLTDRDRQISFLDLQLELLDDFRLRLHQLSQCSMQEVIEDKYCGITNAVFYIANVLEEWNNLPFFLQLCEYKRKKNACLQLMGDGSHPQSVLMQIGRQESKSEDEDHALKSSVFDEVIGLLEHMQKDLLQTLGERVMLDIKAKSRAYRKEKWFCMPIPEDKKSMEITPAAYPMLEVVNSSLHSLQELLAKPLFVKVWQHVAVELNVFLYEEAILQNSFSEGGAVQLNFDMSRNLFPIFGCYTSRPDTYFKLIKDSCVLLNLKSAPALLLKETLKHQTGFDARSSALEELGVYSLSPSQALLILSQRNQSTL